MSYEFNSCAFPGPWSIQTKPKRLMHPAKDSKLNNRWKIRFVWSAWIMDYSIEGLRLPAVLEDLQQMLTSAQYQIDIKISVTAYTLIFGSITWIRASGILSARILEFSGGTRTSSLPVKTRVEAWILRSPSHVSCAWRPTTAEPASWEQEDWALAPWLLACLGRLRYSPLGRKPLVNVGKALISLAEVFRYPALPRWTWFSILF